MEQLGELYDNYKELLDKIADYMIIPDGPITEEQKRKIIKTAVLEYFKGDRKVELMPMLKEATDFVSVDELEFVNKDMLDFIKKYGVENIVRLDKETEMFSTVAWTNTNYILLFAMAEKRLPEFKVDKPLNYEEFKNRIYEILLHIKDAGVKSLYMDFPNYDFIQGEFRREHADIFLDGEFSEDIKRKFYWGELGAEDIKQYPELIPALEGKDLSKLFKKTMIAGMSATVVGPNGMLMGSLPNQVNMAEYLSMKIGTEEFYALCTTYGKCLDEISLMVNGDATVEAIKEKIEEAIYKRVTTKGGLDVSDLPLSFKEKYPDLFLPEEIDKSIRKKFSNGTLRFEDVRENPELVDILLTKNIGVGFGAIKYRVDIFENNGPRKPASLWEKLSEQEILNYASIYGDYLIDIDTSGLVEGQSEEERRSAIESSIETNILSRGKSNRGVSLHKVEKTSPYNENVPEFFKKKYPEMFLAEDAPRDLKEAFYDRGVKRTILDIGDVAHIDFALISQNPEWKEFLVGKDLKRGFPKEYEKLFDVFRGIIQDSRTDGSEVSGVEVSAKLLRVGLRSPETIEQMVRQHKEDLLDSWYRATGGQFVPHHVVMINFPVGEMDSFLENSKKWSQLMRIQNYNLNDEGKTAILKAAYAMGVFKGDNAGFERVRKMFTDIPQEISPEEYEGVRQKLDMEFEAGYGGLTEEEKEEIKGEYLEEKNLFEKAYGLNEEGKYVLRVDKQKDKNTVKLIRGILEKADFPRILTPEKSHQIFDSFIMKYDPRFVKFFNANADEIISNPEYIKYISAIQRRFDEVLEKAAGRKLTLGIAKNIIKSNEYVNVEIGNDEVAEQAKIAGYSQEDFEKIQELYNEGEVREFSSIPRIKGENNGYTYEMLRLDDPLALTIGTLTDCCQEIHGAGQTSMEHSVLSQDGRVFVVRNEQGKIVAQSWVWRNKYVECFDNIEIPDLILTEYEKAHPEVGKKGIITDILEVYKKAAQELMQEDEKVYQELLENGTITKEQYDALLLGRATIGAGYNDIKEVLREARRKGEMGIDASNEILPIKTERLPYVYDDAHYANDGQHDGQYIVTEREGIVKSEQSNLYVYEDEIPEYDESNMKNTVLTTMKRMEKASGRDKLGDVYEEYDESLPEAQRVTQSIAYAYGLNPKEVKVLATARIALVYSRNDGKVKINDLLSAPIKESLTEEQKQKAEAHLTYQLKKAMKQLGVQGEEIDMSELDEGQKATLQLVLNEIEQDKEKEKEKAEGGER